MSWTNKQQEGLNTRTHTRCKDICYLPLYCLCVQSFDCVCVWGDADLLAGTGDPGQAVTVPQGELDLDVDALRSFPADVARPQPVVLVGLHDITHLVGPHRGVPLIHHTDFFPLRMRKRRFRDKGRKQSGSTRWKRLLFILHIISDGLRIFYIYKMKRTQEKDRRK